MVWLAWHGMPWYGWHGMARHGTAWHGMAWHAISTHHDASHHTPFIPVQPSSVRPVHLGGVGEEADESDEEKQLDKEECDEEIHFETLRGAVVCG